MKHMMLKASCGALLVLCSQAVLAHHADPVGELVCDDATGNWQIKVTVTTWENCEVQGGPDECANNEMGVFFYTTDAFANEELAREALEPDTTDAPTAGASLAFTGQLGPSPDAMFMGTAMSPTQTAGDLVFVAAKPLVRWGVNEDSRIIGLKSDYRATTVTIPSDDCEPPPPPEPSLAILKEVSVDGGVTYFDANDEASAPSTLVGGDALYRIKVTNTGDVELVDVLVEDTTLNFSETVTIDVGSMVIFENPMPDMDPTAPNPELYVDPVCTEPGLVPNTATATGNYDGIDLFASDPANVVCTAPEVGCWFTGGQNVQLNRERGQPDHSGGGNIYPSCSALPGDGGQWTHTDHTQDLHFQARSLTVVECGNVPEIEPGAPSPAVSVNFIKATAVGIIKGVGGNELEEKPATAVLIMEDWGEPGRDDKYTIQAMAEDGSAVISIDRAALENGGNFQIHQSSCDN